MTVSKGAARRGGCLQRLGALALAALLPMACWGQEMPGKGMSCWDKQELCNLNCLMPAAKLGVAAASAPAMELTREILNSCLAECDTSASSCKEMPETSQYVDCATACAKTYDGALNACLQKTSATTVGTYDASQDACSNLAAAPMEECMNTCFFGEDTMHDRYGGWSPEREEGHPITSLPRGQFKHPFTDMDVVYGRDWRQTGEAQKNRQEQEQQPQQPQQPGGADRRAQSQLAARAADAEVEALGMLWSNLSVLAAVMLLVGVATVRYLSRPAASTAAFRRRAGRRASSYGAFEVSHPF